MSQRRLRELACVSLEWHEQAWGRQGAVEVAGPGGTLLRDS